MIFKDLAHLTQICFTAALPGFCRPTNLVLLWVYESLAQTTGQSRASFWLSSGPPTAHCVMCVGSCLSPENPQQS